MNRKQNSLMRFSRTERLAQLSEQEIVIEKKKREIQAKLEAQKKKQTEEALRKLESSRESKNNKPVFSKKSSLSGVENPKTSSEKETVELAKDTLTNAFSNDGSFLDQFKKLSQSGFSADKVEMQTLGKTREISRNFKKIKSALKEDLDEKEESNIERNQKSMSNRSTPSVTGEPLDSSAHFRKPSPEVLRMNSHHNDVSKTPSFVDCTSSMVSLDSTLTPQLQGVHNPVHALNTKNIQSNSFQSNNINNSQSVPVTKLQFLDPSFSPEEQENTSEMGGSLSTTTPSVQPLLSVKSQNSPSASLFQVQNAPPPLVPPSELPKLRTESISMTLKCNTVKKLEAIPNPLDVDQPASPVSPERNQCSFTGIKESSKEFFNATSLIENVSHDIPRESPKISSAFNKNDEDGEKCKSLLDEKYHHWAELVAQCGDGFEDSLRNRNQNDPNIRFLLDKNSKEYLEFRKLVLKHRKCLRSSGEVYSEKTKNLNSPHSDDERSMEKITSGSSDEDSNDPRETADTGNTALSKWQAKSHSKFTQVHPDLKMESGRIFKEDGFLRSKKQIFPKENSKAETLKADESRKRKRKSRWGDVLPTASTSGAASNLNLLTAGKVPAPKSSLLSQLTRSDPGLIQYARQTFGSTNLSEEDWKKAEDHYKINLLYQDMVKKRAEVEKLERQGKFKYEYDSDEDTEGGTWEHKLRQQEMQATQLWAEELTRQAAGKHHIGDFLPPEELERFMEKYNAVKEGREPDLSDYKEYKLKEDNVGYRLLQKMGWNEGQGLGQDGSGITNPVNKATSRQENQGLGIERPDGLEAGDDEYDAYRKRMMLAYRFRPNPLNNPRRPYY